MSQTQTEQLIGYLELLGFVKNHTTSCFDVRHCCFNEISRSIPEDLIAKGTVAQKCCQTLSFVGSYNNQSESDNVEWKGH